MSALESWPRRVNGRLVEPIAGAVRIVRPGLAPLEVSTDLARLLAANAGTPRRRVLLDAADEAVRQERELEEAIGG